MTTPKIELLYFDDCPSWVDAKSLLEQIFSEAGQSPEIELIQVETQEEAEHHKFVGSPTIRINGADIFPTGQTHFALGCRVYQTPNGFKGVPTEEMLKERLEPILASN